MVAKGTHHTCRWRLPDSETGLWSAEWCSGCSLTMQHLAQLMVVWAGRSAWQYVRGGTSKDNCRAGTKETNSPLYILQNQVHVSLASLRGCLQWAACPTIRHRPLQAVHSTNWVLCQHFESVCGDEDDGRRASSVNSPCGCV